MAHHITYDGVGGAQGGNIFHGMKFWLAQRLPMRSHFINMIKENGGTVVPLEKHANYLIADHKRRDAPPGSYSFKFIEESVKNAVLQVEDRYRIGPDPDLPRPAGSASLAKGSRTPFTKEDDAVLTRWVLSHNHNRMGNAIYHEFEAVNPRHTWQSWQNRWRKTLSLLPHSELHQMAESAPAHDSSERHAPSTHTESRERRSPQREGFLEPTVPSTQPQMSQPVTEGNEPPEQPRQEAYEQPSESREDQGSQSDQGPLKHQTDARMVDEEESRLGRMQFNTDLETFAAQRGIPIELRPQIGDRSIDLFGLAQVVDSQETHPKDVNWHTVAADLGLNDDDRTSVLLRQCWDENLMEFLQTMAQYEEEVKLHQPQEEEEEEEEDANSREAEQSPSAVRAQPTPSVDLSSTPQTLRTKRGPGHVAEVVSSQHRKRRRLDRSAEIPSTPDDVLRVVRHPHHGEPSTTRRQLFPHVEVRDSQEDTQATLTRPRTPNGNGQRAPVLNSQETAYDVTPSQQLRHEWRLSTTPEQVSAGRDRARRHQVTSSPEPSPPPQESTSTPRDPRQPRQSVPFTSASERPRALKAVRRSLPASFSSKAIHPQPASPPPHRAPQTSTDSYDPFNRPSSTGLKRNSPDSDTIEGWVEHYQAMGYPHDIVIAALKATTMTPGGPAAHAMESLREGRGLPTHHEGVWTDRDDHDLRRITAVSLNGGLDREPTDAQEFRLLRDARRQHARLVNKHGDRRLSLRAQFLLAQDREALL